MDAMLVDEPVVPAPNQMKSDSDQAKTDAEMQVDEAVPVSRSPAATGKKAKRHREKDKVVAAKVEMEKVEKDNREGAKKTKGMKRKGDEQTPKKKPKKSKIS